MKLVTFEGKSGAGFGVLDGDQIIELTGALGAEFTSIQSVLQAQKLQELGALLRDSSLDRLSVDKTAFLPVIPEPNKILCIGLNYEMHRQETGRKKTDHPTVFTRYADSQTGHETAIIMPKVSTQLDYEGELAVIMAKGGRYISEEEALDHVAGYSCYNDGSVREWQYHTTQFTPGKNFPHTGAFGPYLVTSDEIPDVHSLSIQTRLNGEVMQDSNTEMLIFNIPALINYVSSFTPLAPGDVIVSGTPGGVGAKRNPPVWMKPGDTVEVEIEKVGLLRNAIALEE